MRSACYTHSRISLVPRPQRYISGKEAPPDRVTGAQQQGCRSIFNVPQGLRTRLLAGPSSTQAMPVPIHDLLVKFCNEAACAVRQPDLRGHGCPVLCACIYISIQRSDPHNFKGGYDHLKLPPRKRHLDLHRVQSATADELCCLDQAHSSHPGVVP